MINTIINALYDIASKQKYIRSFAYKKREHNGNGNEQYPMLFVEEPIFSQINTLGNIITHQFSFSITMLPRNLSVEDAQTSCFMWGLSIIQKLSDKFTVEKDWTVLTLRDYYDNNSAGVRFTVNVEEVNPTNSCTFDDLYFDDTKTFSSGDTIGEITINSPSGNCVTFNNKIDFDLNL
jgi:hypothetical protein